MIANAEIALGVPVFKRTKKLRTLLESVERVPIDVVYVADNGHIEERQSIYQDSWEFDLTMLDVEYDSGLGNCRSKIVDKLGEDYLLVVDSDHEVPHNVDTLIRQLEAEPDLGGVCGLLLEHSGLRGTCHDLFEEDDFLVRDIRSTELRVVAGAPLFEFDFLQNVAAFRRECVEEYSWDPELQQGKPHLDFYIGHKQQTDWSFGVCPEVQFPHHPGGSSNYEAHRSKQERLAEAREYFLEKWGYDQILFGNIEWLDNTGGRPSTVERLKQVVKQFIMHLPLRAQAKVMDLRLLLRKARGRPPL